MINVPVDWEKFNPKQYVVDNYSYVHDEDRQILDLLVDFYRNKSFGRALEVGVGPNLYPLIAMLPFVNRIECVEFSSKNIEYLRKQIQKPAGNWIKFHKYLIEKSKLYRFPLQKCLASKVKVCRGSIFDLSEGVYDLASMNFVAESISDNWDDFERACDKFIKSVKSGGCLVASFMENSSGYVIDGVEFPAYPADRSILLKAFSHLTTNLIIHQIKLAQVPLRPGYSGVLLLTARRK